MRKQSLRCDFTTFLNVVVALSSTMAIPAYTLFHQVLVLVRQQEAAVKGQYH